MKDLREEAFNKNAEEVETHDYYKYRISFTGVDDVGLLILFVTGLTDKFDNIKKELLRCKREFLNLFEDIIQHKFDSKTFEVFDPTVDAIHRNLRPKISLVGFSGVGKTTITKLIRAEEIPMQHIPTITGDIATIKIGKLHFHLWDFAGQEQFSYLWTNFIKGSDAVLLISDSSLENVEKSKFFLELIKEQANHAQSAVIANKQDLPKALKPEEIENMLGLKAYSMIAIDPDNRDKMIKIIADVLEMNAEVSPLLKPLLDRDEKMAAAEQALENGNFQKAANLFDEISDLCIDLGDDSLSREFYDKARKIKSLLKSQQKEVEDVKPSEEEKVEVKAEKEEKVEEVKPEKKEVEEETKDIIKEKEVKIEETEKKSKEEKTTLKKPTIPRVKPLPKKAKLEEEKKDVKTEEKETVKKETTPATEESIGLKLNPQDFMIKKRPKKVVSVPKDAKKKLKTSSFGHVKNPTEPKTRKVVNPSELLKQKTESKKQAQEESKTKKPKKPPEPPSLSKPTPPSVTEAPESETKSTPPSINVGPSQSSSSSQKTNIKQELMDLKIKKAKISKMALDFEMKELSGEITAQELAEKKSRLDKMEENITQQIKELEELMNS
ncbi:MAG: GTP-binding protein [Candidatus Lokiarchaeota archaeon]|nr:GTP-binding protein [Candidatus Lokiarchaeota archaeon]MBD3199647.1 GTP-binding protein [Candidatus Lokiarchaeota archaeon]